MKPTKSLRNRSRAGVKQRSSEIVTRRKSAAPAIQLASILVPLDFSNASMRALTYADAVAKQFDGKLTLLYVLEPLAMSDFVQSSPMMLGREEMIKVCESKLRAAAAKADVSDEKIKAVLVREGRAYQEIAATAAQLRVDVIVISTHGYSGLAHTLLGSVAERVVRHAPCPVLVVRRDSVQEQRNRSAERRTV